MIEELVCESCNGTGFIMVDGRTDFCDSCYGLGYVKERYMPTALSENKMKIKRAFIATFISLAIFYGAFSYSFIRLSLGPVQTLVILLTGHLLAISFLVFYILHRAVVELRQPL